MTIDKFIKTLDFKENDYFYHVTGSGKAESISQKGLYVDGNNIINTNNLVETTALPLTEDMVLTNNQFKEFLIDETKNLGVRDTSEMIIIGAPKIKKTNIVSNFDGFVDGSYYEGIIPKDYIMGYFSNDNLEFTKNEDFKFLSDEIDDSLYIK